MLKAKLKFIFSVLLVSVLCLGFFSCKNDSDGDRNYGNNPDVSSDPDPNANITGLKLDKVVLPLGGDVKIGHLTGYVIPREAHENIMTKLNWHSSDTNIAIVEGAAPQGYGFAYGTVKLVEGAPLGSTAIITATTDDGKFPVTCKAVVVNFISQDSCSVDEEGNLTISDDVTYLGGTNFFFYNNGKKVKHIVIPSRIIGIECSLLDECDNLEDVTFEDPNGWFYKSEYGQNGYSINVGDPAFNAEELSGRAYKPTWHGNLYKDASISWPDASQDPYNKPSNDDNNSGNTGGGSGGNTGNFSGELSGEYSYTATNNTQEVITFENGNYSIKTNGGSLATARNGTYTVNGSTLTLTPSSINQPYEFTLDGDSSSVTLTQITSVGIMTIFGITDGSTSITLTKN